MRKVLKKGLSRGDGVTGEDILENLKTIRDSKKIEDVNVPSLLDTWRNIYWKKDFHKIKGNFAILEMQPEVHLDKKIQKKHQKYHLNILHMVLEKYIQ